MSARRRAEIFYSEKGTSGNGGEFLTQGNTRIPLTQVKNELTGIPARIGPKNRVF
jgi:hypothetical protein